MISRFIFERMKAMRQGSPKWIIKSENQIEEEPDALMRKE